MSQPAREIELKFHCAPEALDAVWAAAPAGEDRLRTLHSTYFDTADGALAARGAALRIRRDGEARIQTLKQGEGLTRAEHEQPVNGDDPDRGATALDALLPPEAVLEPVFAVQVQRRQRRLSFAGARIELALDQGEILAGDRRRPISEVELELLEGRAQALFDLARILACAAPLYLGFESKAAQGRALRAEAVEVVRRPRPVLGKSDTAGGAFQAVARSALAQIAGNAGRLRQGSSAEAVHQLRVAARRLRSALSTFSPVVRDGRWSGVRQELRWLAQACNDARDLDVFADEVLKPAMAPEPQDAGLAALAEATLAARARAGREVAEAVASERFRSLILETAAWAETGAWTEDPTLAELRDGPAVRFAGKALDRQMKRLRRRGKALETASDEARHEARIEAKKLRYAAEAFAGLFPPRRADRFIRRLKTLQDELGAVNDTATAGPLLARLGLEGEAAAAAQRLLQRKGVAKSRHVRRAARALAKLEDGPPFWR